MKKKTKLIFYGVILFAALLIISRFVRFPLLGATPEEAVPRHTAVLLSLNKATLDRISATSDKNSLARLMLPDALAEDVNDFEKIFGETIPMRAKDGFLAVVQPSRLNGFDILFILDGVRGKNLEKMLSQNKDWRFRKSIFRKSEVFTLQTGTDQLAVARYRNLLLFARHAYLVENALSQLKSPSTSLHRETGFKKTFKSARAEAENLHVLLNFNQLGAEFAPFLEASRMKDLNGLKQSGSWLHLELPTGKQTYEWKGSFVANPGQPLLAANSQGTTLPFKNVFRAMPDNLSLFFWLSVGKIKPKASGEWQKYFASWAGNEVAVALGEPMEKDAVEQFLLLKTTDTKKAEAALVSFAEKTGKLETFDFQMFKVQQWMGNSLGEMLGLGEAFKNPYSCVLGEYVLFSNSKAGTERWLGKFIAGQTYSKNVRFLQSLRALPVESQGFIYAESVRSWQQLSQFFTQDFLAGMGGNPLKFNHLAATMKRRGALCELHLTTPGAAVSQDEQPANILWKVPLAAKVTRAPTAFHNLKNGEMEVFVQDSENRIYLVSRSGRILWRRNLEEPLLSEVFQLNLHNNDESQFAFNTASGIYLVDHQAGSDLAGFPLQLQTPATNGLTVIDFFKSHDYQFFIACENGNAYGFDEKGNPVEGWRPKTGIGIVRHPLVHFQAQGMDFMILQDETGRMQVFQKNGTDRFPAKKFESVFPQAPDYQASNDAFRIVACDEDGKVSVMNLKGEDFRLSLGNSPGEQVKFAFADVSGDDRKDYLALSKNALSAYFYEGNSFKKAFEYQFQQAQDGVFPVAWKGRDKAFIGTFSKEKKQLYLLDGSGRLLPQFPLAGTTPFSVVDLLGDGKPVLITGNENYLFGYAL